MPRASEMAFDAGLIRPPIGPLFEPPPYPDLAVSQVYVGVNRSEGTMCAGAYVENLGGAPPDRPFTIAIAVTLLKEPDYTAEYFELFSIPQDVEFPLQTPCTQAELAYRDLPGSARYTIEVLIDPEYELYDLNRANNFYSIPWWIVSPAMAKGTEPVRIVRSSLDAS
jgi:hypothetical protein